MGNRYYTAPSDSWSAYYRWLEEQNQKSGASSGVGIGRGAGQIAGAIGGRYAIAQGAEALGFGPASGVVGFGADAGAALPTFGAEMGADAGAVLPTFGAEMGATEGAGALGSAGPGAYAGPIAAAIAAGTFANKAYEGVNRKGKAKYGDELSAAESRDELNPAYALLGKNKVTKNLYGPIWNAHAALPGSSWMMTKIANAMTDNKTVAEDRRKKALEAAGYGDLGDPANFEKSTHYDRWDAQKAQAEKDIAEYGADYVGAAKDDPNRWINNKFFSSRDEADADARSIANFATFYEQGGKDSNFDRRMALADLALKAGAGREHHGTWDVDWSKVDQGELAKAMAIGLAPEAAPEPDAGSIRRWRDADSDLMRKYGYA